MKSYQSKSFNNMSSHPIKNSSSKSPNKNSIPNYRQQIDQLHFSERYLNTPKRWYPEQKKFMQRVEREVLQNDDEFIKMLEFKNQNQWMNTFSDLKLIKSFIIKARKEYIEYIKNAPKNGYIPLPSFSKSSSKNSSEKLDENYLNAILYFDRKIPKQLEDKDGTIRKYHGTFGKYLKVSHFAPLYPYVNDGNWWTNEKIWFNFYPNQSNYKIFKLNQEVIDTFKKLGKECLKSMLRLINLDAFEHSSKPSKESFKDKSNEKSKPLNEKSEEKSKEYLQQLERQKEDLENKLKNFNEESLDVITNGYPEWFIHSQHKPVNIIETEDRNINKLIDLILSDEESSNESEKSNDEDLENSSNDESTSDKLKEKLKEIQSYLQNTLKYNFPFSTKFGPGVFQEEFTPKRAIQILGIELFKTFIITPYPVKLMTRIKDFNKFIQNPNIAYELPYITKYFVEYYKGQKIQGSNLREAREFHSILLHLKPFLAALINPTDTFSFQTSKHIYVYSMKPVELSKVTFIEDGVEKTLFVNYIF